MEKIQSKENITGGGMNFLCGTLDVAFSRVYHTSGDGVLTVVKSVVEFWDRFKCILIINELDTRRDVTCVPYEIWYASEWYCKAS
jgi:hypothetical protein